ncbi:hypothetical protein CASFOL_022968 [Castilleja foliolosa]|uniref:RNase H type-1 domain-containing protein n=1 Tax=Castilleja foliolosa TaxID=1961234 RepID=A0ABD3CWL3_9LAMI
MILVDSVTKQIKDHWRIMATKATVKATSNNPWKPPPEGWTKANTDAAFSNDVAAAGVVLKNHRGSIFATSTCSNNCENSITAEALAILHGCTQLDKLKIKKAIIESDCCNAISDITLPAILNSWKAEPIYDEIKKIWGSARTCPMGC